jgi:hypothetical protein
LISGRFCVVLHKLFRLVSTWHHAIDGTETLIWKCAYQAYAWGFDIREWGKHVNGLTWPEILRQFALAAGFGPKWKKQNMTSNVSKDEQEVRKQVPVSGSLVACLW